MARDLITPVKTSEMTTAAAMFESTANSIPVNATNGAYIKTTGIDATRLLFFVSRNSSECSTAGRVTVVSGSTGGNIDFQPGQYSTANNLDITIAKTTDLVMATSQSSANFNLQYFSVPETARFKDTDGYIKFNFNAEMTSATNPSHGARMGALYLAP